MDAIKQGKLLTAVFANLVRTMTIADPAITGFLFEGIREAAKANIGGAVIELGELADVIRETSAVVNDSLGTMVEGFVKLEKGASDLQLGVQSAFTSLVVNIRDAFRGMENDNLTTLERMAEAVQQFAASVERTMLELAAKNLGEAIFGSLSGGKGGESSTLGSIATIAGSILASVLHSGGTVGQGGASRMVPALAFAGAPRFASGGIAGLGPNEVPAILHKGETVIPAGKGVGGSTTIVNQTINLNFSSVDARGMDTLLRSHAGTIAQVVGEAAQEGRGFRRLMRGR